MVFGEPGDQRVGIWIPDKPFRMRFELRSVRRRDLSPRDGRMGISLRA